MSISQEFDIRLYTAAGKRKRLPQGWVDSLNFEIGERGGCLTGALSMAIEWELLGLDGTEYVDVRLFGSSQVIYRGWCRTAQQELGTPEKASPQLYGMMELLNGFIVPRDLSYGFPVTFDTPFSDIHFFYILPNIPNTVLDVSGVASLGLLIQQLAVSGKTVTQAFNALCDAAPQQIIWGCDVDSSGNNRVYLRPRSTAVKYKISVGGQLTAFVYPRDATQVVNRVHLTGAKASVDYGYAPNICPNASFETTRLPGELTGNILLNPGFDLDNGGTQPGAGWMPVGGSDPSIDTTAARSSPNNAVLDNNPTTPEGIYQDLPQSGGRNASGSFWALCGASETWTFDFILEWWDGTGPTLLDSMNLSATVPNDNTYHHFEIDFTSPSAGAATFLRWKLITSSGSGAHGLNIDDCSCWLPGLLLADGWEAAGGSSGSGTGGGFSYLDWAFPGSSALPCFDGGQMVETRPRLVGGAGVYAQIKLDRQHYAQTQINFAYVITCHVRVAIGDTAQVQLCNEQYDNTGASLTVNSGTLTTIHGTDGWVELTLSVTAGGLSAQMSPLVRFFTDGVTVYLDGMGVFQGSTPPDLYYPGDTITAVRDVTDYSGSVNSDALASASSWGLREAAVSQDTIQTKALLDAWAVGYFNAHAVPAIQARLDIEGADAPINLDGTVRLVNLPAAPAPLFPSKVRYEVAETIKLSADLNNERPDLALLLRQMVVGAPTG